MQHSSKSDLNDTVKSGKSSAFKGLQMKANRDWAINMKTYDTIPSVLFLYRITNTILEAMVLSKYFETFLYFAIWFQYTYKFTISFLHRTPNLFIKHSFGIAVQ